MGEHVLQSQTVLPLVAAAFTVAPQRHICRAVTDVVGGHDGTCMSGVRSRKVSFRQVKEAVCFRDVNMIETKVIMAIKTGRLYSMSFYTGFYFEQLGRKSDKLLYGTKQKEVTILLLQTELKKKKNMLKELEFGFFSSMPRLWQEVQDSIFTQLSF